MKKMAEKWTICGAIIRKCVVLQAAKNSLGPTGGCLKKDAMKVVLPLSCCLAV